MTVNKRKRKWWKERNIRERDIGIEERTVPSVDRDSIDYERNHMKEMVYSCYNGK